MTHSSLAPATRGQLATAWLRIIEGVAALLVVLDIVVLFAGVVARYIFDRPLIWSDELAASIFLWLGMLGAVLALSRNEHMRLSAFLKYFSPRVRHIVDAIAALMVVIFVIEIIGPAYNYVVDQWMIVTPGLDVPDSFRVAAILVGGALMSLVALQFLFVNCRSKDIAIAVIVIAIVSAVLVLASPALIAMGNWNLPIFFVLIVGTLVIIGVPIAFAFGVTTLSYIVLTTDVPLFILVNQMDHGMSSLILLAIPLFIFLGLLIDVTGMAAALVNFLAALVGHFRGGLSYVLLGAMYLVSGISGAKAADMAAIAPILLPEMKKRGYKEGETVALLAASSAMSETIPPSLILITIGSVTGVSIAALFIGGLLPAVVGALALGITAYFRTRGDDNSLVERARAGVVLKALLFAMPALVLPLVIRFAVVEGIATATEVSTVGVVYTLIVGPIFYGKFDWRKLYPLLVETAALSGAILLIIGTATGMGWALTQSGFAQVLVTIMSDLPGGKVTFMILSIILFAVTRQPS